MFQETFEKKIVHCALNSLANYDQALFSANFHVLSLFSAQLAYPYITRGGLESIFVSIHYCTDTLLGRLLLGNG